MVLENTIEEILSGSIRLDTALPAVEGGNAGSTLLLTVLKSGGTFGILLASSLLIGAMVVNTFLVEGERINGPDILSGPSHVVRLEAFVLSSTFEDLVGELVVGLGDASVFTLVVSLAFFFAVHCYLVASIVLFAGFDFLLAVLLNALFGRAANLREVFDLEGLREHGENTEGKYELHWRDFI